MKAMAKEIQIVEDKLIESSKDLGSSDGSSIKIDKDNGINVQVVLRCRPLSEDEKRAKMPVAISCNEHKHEVSVIQNAANKHLDKSFVFDKLLGPKSQQKDLYEQDIASIVNEALEGYNSTIFTIEGIELIKCGKLNLVDLAGVETILRSGAREAMAQKIECMEVDSGFKNKELYINQQQLVEELSKKLEITQETYTQKIDAQYIEDNNVVESVNDGLEEGLRHRMEKENMVAKHWRNAKDSLLSLQRRNVDSMNSIVKGGVEANQVIRAWFYSVALSTMEEAIATNKSFLSSIDSKGGVEANQVTRAWFSSVALSTMEKAIATNKSFLSSIDVSSIGAFDEAKTKDNP
ncbi:hypothetical protein TEA_011485 [Camellia sinensis var. sinensis]|uniref:Kinesin motor domain-containing protein n=1 Tax=Camellia sinensis var. sinensis TaxID=542762 RepID=A0A4S4CWK7_CAMSN|nr:hypothetical protein TEA_011485 [Camellia sinensis var. sinensis]